MWEPEGHDGLRLTAELPLGTRFDGFLELGPAAGPVELDGRT